MLSPNNHFSSITLLLITTALLLLAAALQATGKPPSGMIALAGGSFMMGCAPDDKQCEFNETPRHQAAVDAFFMSSREVTVKEYAACVDAGACAKPGAGGYCNWGVDGRTNHPINCVDWNQAKAYCSWKDQRLPTEAEWEYAARGKVEGSIFPWGNGRDCGKANYCDKQCAQDWKDGTCDDGFATTAPVGSFAPNGFGLYDMTGNVAEWCSDWYRPQSYVGVAGKNPRGPVTGTFHVYRGGSWYEQLRHGRLSDRERGTVDLSHPSVGFRCVKDE